MKTPLVLLLAFATAALDATGAGAPAAVRSFESTPTELRVACADGVLVLQPLRADAIRVRFAKPGVTPRPSLVLNQPLPSAPFRVTTEPGLIRLSTEKVQVTLDQESGALTFRDAAGAPLLREPPGGGRRLTRATVDGNETFTVQQVFQSPPDEGLYGLGEFQDGLWNWRGIPLELRQFNTQIAVPMLVSSRGYGVLWDNASLTQFNPVDREIPLHGGAARAAASGANATEDLAAGAGGPARVAYKTGAFTTDEPGDYVFLANGADRRDDFALLVDGKQVAGVTNKWTPRALSAKVRLPGHATVSVAVRGGGPDTRLFGGRLGDTTVFRSQMGEGIDYTFFSGPSVDAIIAGYRALTGKAPLWPKWAYGFWQSRERYSSQQQILDAVAEYRRRRIPMDLIVQDWQYWGPHGWGAYEWDARAYPDPAAMIRAIHDEHAKFMISVWCNPRGAAGDDLRRHHALIGDWIDVFSAEGRQLRWKHLNDAFYRIGTDAWWGDSTEPSDGGEALAGKATSAGPGSRLRNSYPLFASQSLYEGQLSANPDARVCILTRCAYPGIQRYAAAAWSGDIRGDWESYRRQIPAGLNFSVTGIPYWTTDTGGFFRPPDQYASADYNELLARWFQWSTFCPVLRIHGYRTETELWRWRPETQRVLVAYDELRYRLLPYVYSVAWRVWAHDDTFLRPLVMDFPRDAKALSVADEYLFGPAFLVAPVTQPLAQSGGTRRVYLPAGADWIDFWTGERHAGGGDLTVSAPLARLPLFVRAGAIIPFGPVQQYATEKPDAPYELRVYRGADGEFTVYEDDNETNAYRHGAGAQVRITWSEAGQRLTLGARTGDFPGLVRERRYRVVFVGAGHGVGAGEASRADVDVRYTGTEVTVAAP